MTIYLKNRQGAALIIVLIAFTLMFIFGVSALFISSNSVHQIKNDRAEITAQYLAQSGLDATIEHLKTTTGSFASETLLRVYYDKVANTFTESAPATANQLGYVDTTINYNNTTGICSISSVGTANGESITVNAVSSPLIYEIPQNTLPNTVPTVNTYSTTNWYYYNKSKGKYYINGNNGSKITFTGSDGFQRIMSYYFSEGVSVIETPDNSMYPLELANDTISEAHRRVGYGAKALFFSCPVYLQRSQANQYDAGFLIAAAETIVFKQPIIMTERQTGVLVLNLPHGYGIPGEVVYQNVLSGSQGMVDLNATYGKVYFNGVSIRTYGPFGGLSNSLLSNKSFYFKPDPSLSDNMGLPIGYNYNGDDYSYSELISRGLLIPATPTTVPDPVDLVRFTYSR